MRMRFKQRFSKQQGGAALIEFAFVFPVLLVLFLGASELTRFTLTVMRLQKSVYVLTDIITQSTPATAARDSGEINVSTVQSALSQLQHVVGGSDAERVMIVTSIQRVGAGGMVIRWQQSGGGSLTRDVLSVTGAGPCGGCAGVGMNPVTIAGYDLSDTLPDENMIVGEVFYYYQPLLSNLLSSLGVVFEPRTLHRTIFMLPRQGPLLCLPDSFVYSECS